MREELPLAIQPKVARQNSVERRVRMSDVPRLEPGDHLDQTTFHERYEAMGESVRAELMGGVVYMPSPVGMRHSGSGGSMFYWLKHYDVGTPGVAAHDNATVILGEDDEVQPDGLLAILPEFGG